MAYNNLDGALRYYLRPDLEMDVLAIHGFYLAGLQNIDYSVYEAAAIDGAPPWTTFWKITAPF